MGEYVILCTCDMRLCRGAFLLLFQMSCSHATWGMCSWRTGWRCRCYFFHLIFFTFVCFLFSLQEHHRSYLLFFVCCLVFAFLCLPCQCKSLSILFSSRSFVHPVEK